MASSVDWLTWVADRSRENKLFRHDLDRWGTPVDKAEKERNLSGAVSGLLALYPIEVFLAAREQERPPPRHVATFGVFGPPGAVVCVVDFPPQVGSGGHTVDVMAAGKKLTFKAKAIPVLQRLLSGHPVDIEQSTIATGINAAVLAETLMREGVCAELTDELSSGYTGLVTSVDY